MPIDVLRLIKRKTQAENLADCGLLYPVSKSDLELYKRLYLAPTAIKSIEISSLKNAVCLDWDKIIMPFFKNEKGDIDRSITNSPHIKLLGYYKKHGIRKLKKNFRELDYYKMFKKVNEIGYKTDYFNLKNKIPVHYTDKSIWRKIAGFIKLYKSIQKNGYLGGLYQGRYISVLEKPFVVTRFNWEENAEPYELFVGHHRAACLSVLDYNFVDVLVLKDVK